MSISARTQTVLHSLHDARATDIRQGRVMNVFEFKVPREARRHGSRYRAVAVRGRPLRTLAAAATLLSAAPSLADNRVDISLSADARGDGLSAQDIERQVAARLAELHKAGGASTLFGVKALDKQQLGEGDTAVRITRTGNLLSVSLAIDGLPPMRFTVPRGQPKDLVDGIAEHVLTAMAPFRFAAAMTNLGRTAEALPVYARLARSAPTQLERGVANAVWSYRLLDLGRYADAERKALAGVRLAPELGRTWYRLWEVRSAQGQAEQALSDIRTAADRLRDDPQGLYDAQPRLLLYAISDCERMLIVGELPVGESPCRTASAARSRTSAWQLPMLLALAHDLAGATAALKGIDQGGSVPVEIQQTYARRRAEALGALRFAQEDWKGAEEAFAEGVRAAPAREIVLKPWLAVALARQGAFGAAAAQLAKLPNACYPCQRARGLVEMLAGGRRQAERAFAAAVRLAPSLPWAHLDWAELLLNAGDAKSAAAHAEAAMKLAPRLADGYVLRGRALALSEDWKSAEGAFATAARLAPAWGEARIRHGQALRANGRRQEAEAAFTVAAALALNPSERRLLAAVR